MKSTTEKKEVFNFNLYECMIVLACNFMLHYNLSVRESAKRLGISKSTMQKYTQEVKLIDENIYNELQNQKNIRKHK